MRLFAFSLAFTAVLAAPASARNLGVRTTSPEAMIAEMSPTSPEDEMRELIAAADAYPLGSAENPIRVAGPDGERAYLARLRCADGSVPRVGARGEAGVGAYGSIVAGYEVGCGAGGGRLVFDMYQAEHVETRAPAGFTLAPQ